MTLQLELNLIYRFCREGRSWVGLMPFVDPQLRKEKQREYQARFYRANKKYYIDKARVREKELYEWFHTLKSVLSCVKCGESHPACLDFHHKDPRKKDLSLSRAVQQGWSRERILGEIEKCDVLCSNCHRKLHYAGIQSGDLGS